MYGYGVQKRPLDDGGKLRGNVFAFQIVVNLPLRPEPRVGRSHDSCRQRPLRRCGRGDRPGWMFLRDSPALELLVALMMQECLQLGSEVKTRPLRISSEVTRLIRGFCATWPFVLPTRVWGLKLPLSSKEKLRFHA